MDRPDLRLLLVHAHPDDEVIQSGLTMARYAGEGVGVTLVTCTLGEEGEVLDPDFAHLANDRDDRLGEHRIGELADAMSIMPNVAPNNKTPKSPESSESGMPVKSAKIMTSDAAPRMMHRAYTRNVS